MQSSSNSMKICMIQAVNPKDFLRAMLTILVFKSLKQRQGHLKEMIQNLLSCRYIKVWGRRKASLSWLLSKLITNNRHTQSPNSSNEVGATQRSPKICWQPSRTKSLLKSLAPKRSLSWVRLTWQARGRDSTSISFLRRKESKRA